MTTPKIPNTSNQNEQLSQNDVSVHESTDYSDFTLEEEIAAFNDFIDDVRGPFPKEAVLDWLLS